VASFPDVAVIDNWSPADSSRAASAPLPRLTVTLNLITFGDYTYVGGPPPVGLNDLGWTWKATNEGRGRGFTQYDGSKGAESDISSHAFSVEARSSSEEEQANNAEFKSGAVFGVAAAALIAAIQEFVKSATEGGRAARRKRSADTGT